MLCIPMGSLVFYEDSIILECRLTKLLGLVDLEFGISKTDM